MAVLLGPGGVGLIGTYLTIVGLIGTITSLGIDRSGIRQISAASGTGDGEKISRTITTLRRFALVLGILGASVTVILSSFLSHLTFGTGDHAWALILLSVTLIFNSVSNGQTALIQGMLRIKDLAMLSIIGGLLGTVLSIPLIYFFGFRGIIPFLIILSAMTFAASWWYARKISIVPVIMKWKETWTEAHGLLRLGIVFMSMVLMTAVVAYTTRVLIIGQLGLDATGLYQAGYTLSAVYVGFILNAMSADFYPRLTAVAGDNDACRQMVNEQAEVTIILAVPGIIATLIFAPLVIQILYSAKFLAAIDMLRWQMLGILVSVLSWPIGIIIIAEGSAKLLFLTQLLMNSMHIVMIWALMKYFALTGVGMAFFCMNVFGWLLVFFVVRRIANFSFLAHYVRKVLVLFPVVILSFLLPYFMTQTWTMLVGTLLIIMTSLYSLKTLHGMVGQPSWVDLMRIAKSRLGIVG